ncbi:MAG: TIGR00300 family protein [Caldisericia bacterium]|nr:TIGR00300 family protein [Caldisericia bacterium]
MHREEIELRGHIIDSMILPKIFDVIMNMGGEFEILEFEIGKRRELPSYAKLLVMAEKREVLEDILEEVQKLGATLTEEKEVNLSPVEKDGVAPDNFYSTTNHKTYIRLNKKWIYVKNPEMDCVIVVKGEEAETKPINELKKGEMVVTGFDGIRIEPPERPRGNLGPFEFMNSDVSIEKPKGTLIRAVAREIKKIKEKDGKIGVVVGPAVVHTGAHVFLAEMIRLGFVDAFFGGNAIAVHDIEYALFGTSLGINIETGEVSEHGHRNHLRAINTIRKIGSIKKAVETHVLKSGVMYELVKNHVPFVLAGSIRDDGPLPEVVTDTIVAQRKMRELLRDIDLILMMSTMLHSIAVGNLIPSYVKTVCIDINPSVVTKLMDRGSAQTLGIVTDVGEFLPLLVRELKK